MNKETKTVSVSLDQQRNLPATLGQPLLNANGQWKPQY